MKIGVVVDNELNDDKRVLREIEILKETGDMRFWALEPNRSATINGYRVSTNAFGLRDRGHLKTGLRADLVRFKVLGATPVLAAVWSQGERAF